MRFGRFVGNRQPALAVVSGLVLIAATSGIAGGALKTKRTEVTIAGADGRSVTATCQKGTRAISGGFDAPGSRAEEMGSPSILTFQSKRVGTRKWTTFSANTQVVAGPLVGFAYCSDALPKLKSRSDIATVGLDQARTATAKCPRGGEAVSGGFVAQDDPEDSDPSPFESRRVGKRKWQVSAINFRPERVKFTAIAYCAKHRLGLEAASTEVTNSTNGVNLSAKARCKRGSRALSGGFSGEITANFERETYPFRSLRSGRRGWLAGAFSFVTGGESVDWKAFAYCLDKDEL